MVTDTLANIRVLDFRTLAPDPSQIVQEGFPGVHD